MRDSVRLGRIAGIQVGVNWSVFAVFLLIVIGLGAGRFPAAYPGRPGVLYAVAALVAGTVFFASLLAHEIAHAVVARRNGVEVDGITLWLLGGVARLRGEARSPGAELRIAGVGPAVSALLAVIFGGGAALLATVGARGLELGVLAWLAGINAIIAVFNIIPAAPLDGGRLLRAFLWWRRGNRYSASITAARIGRIFGYVLIVLGLLDFLFGRTFSGLWLALIGIFLVAAASAEEQHAQAQQALTDVRARDLMSADPMVAPEDLTVNAFLDRFVFGAESAATRHSTFPVVGPDRRPTGLITLSRVRQVPPERRAQTVLRDVACPLSELPVVDVDEPVIDLLPRMAGCSEGRALVMRNTTLAGIISPSDITNRLEWSRLRPPPMTRHPQMLPPPH